MIMSTISGRIGVSRICGFTIPKLLDKRFIVGFEVKSNDYNFVFKPAGILAMNGKLCISPPANSFPRLTLNAMELCKEFGIGEEDARYEVCSFSQLHSFGHKWNLTLHFDGFQTRLGFFRPINVKIPHEYVSVMLV